VNSKVILLVEDDVHEQYFVWKLLKADGFAVLTAGNGEFALEASRSHPGPIDLLLTDTEMPRMSGLELGRNIRAERPEIKVLMMSSDLRGGRTGFRESTALPSKAVHRHGPAGFHRSVAQSDPVVDRNVSPLGNYSHGEIV
jgi:CheY-like chemotaxis protein